MQKGDVTPLLKWVPPAHEAEIVSAFQRALRIRQATPQASAAEDEAFFSLLVRIHRAGEGAAFSGIKPAGTPLSPAITAADKAVESGSDRELFTLLAKTMQNGLARRLNDVREKHRTVNASVPQGREYVAAYVAFVHYVEALEKALEGGHGGTCDAAAEPPQGTCKSCAHRHP